MRILFVAYCIIRNENGDSMLGVYKRALRIAMEMVRRGHEAWMICPGQQDCQDELAYEAEACIHFVDFPARLMLSPRIELRRRCYRMALRKLQPDLIVVGEAPLSGVLLDASVCARDMGIRQVMLDNAFSPRLARTFVSRFGSMFDGIVLNGPSSLQMRRPPEYYCAAPPYIEGSSSEAGDVLERSGLRPKRWITVLGYENRAQQLAKSLLPQIIEPDCAAVWLTSDPAKARMRLAALAPQAVDKTIFVSSPRENLLFGLLQLSNLVIGNCDFAHVGECLALRTPFLGATYPGCFPVSFLQRGVRQFVHAANADQLDSATVKTARWLVHRSSDEMNDIHNGRFGATSMVADFLEQLPAVRRTAAPRWSVFRKYRGTRAATQVFSRGSPAH